MKLRTWCIRMGQILTKTVLVFTGFLIFLILFKPAISKAEDDRGGITIRQQNAPIEKVFQSIEKQSGYRFFYNETLLQGAGKVSLNLQNVSLQEALEACFLNQPLSYAIVDKTIIVKKRQEQQPKAPEVAAVALSRPGKIIALRGKVTSGKLPVAGASIMIKGTENGASTDKDGMFTLPEVEDDATLVVSSVSHTAREVRLNGQTFISIDLSQRTDDLDEAVVVAYNTTTRRMNTGAVTVVKGQEIQNLPNRSFDRGLQGMVPGLLVTQGTGQPGGGVSNFVLRGIATAADPQKGSTARNPLIVIDGIPVSQDQFQIYIDNVQTPITNPISQLNPSDIESITVLKDASAIALYGARASNGVIVVTTKKGKSGKPQFNIRHQTDIASPLNGKVKLLNKDEYLELLTEAYRNSNSTLYPDDASVINKLKTLFPVMADGSFYPGTDWLAQIFNNRATTISNELSVSGGNQKNNFYLNLEYTKQEGIALKSGYDRKSMRFNYEYSPANWLKFGLNTAFSYNLQDYGLPTRGYNGPVASAISPLNPVRYEDGSFVFNYLAGGGPQSASEFANPVAQAEFNINRNVAFRSLNKLYGELTFLRHFKFSSTFGLDYMQSESKEKADPRLYDPGNFASGIGRIEEQDVRRANIISTNVLKYDWSRQKHTFNVLAGQEAQIMSQRNLLVAVNNLQVPYYDQINSPGVTMFRYDGANRKETLLSYFAQGNYDYKNRYFFTGSIRRDGSSRFGADKQYGTYWSTGAGWVISSEPIMQFSSSWLSFLKLRGSVGAAGNAAAIDRYTKYDQLRNLTYLGGTAVYPTSIPGNSDVKWERTFTWDAGAEIRLFADRIALTADIYNRKTSDLIYSIDLPQNSGYYSVLTNIGKIENKGVELSASLSMIRNKNFRWNINANWSTNANKLLKANVPIASLTTNQIGNKEGENFNSFYLVRWAGVNPDNGKPQWVDSTGKFSEVYNAAKREFVGKPQPDAFGAINNTIAYKGIEFFFMLYYQYGYQMYISDDLLNDGRYAYMNQDRRALNRWKNQGDIVENPKRILNGNSSSTGHSTRFLYDGDYIRLQNVGLSYSIPKKTTDRLRFNSIKLFLQGNNLATWTKFPGFDPGNVNVGGGVTITYPNQRSFSIGLNANF